jgi:hypothetical protein
MSEMIKTRNGPSASVDSSDNVPVSGAHEGTRMLLLVVLIALSLVAMTGFFGIRGGAYRGRGVVVGIILIAAALALLLTGRVR